MRGAISHLRVTLVINADTNVTVHPVPDHPASAVIEIGDYYTAECALHVRAGDIERLTAALTEARDLLQANASAVAA